MHKLLLTVLLLSSLACFSQEKPILWIDVVKIKNNHTEEALFFYEKNWQVYRDSALKAGFITSYQLLQTVGDTAADADLLLITEYPNREAYEKREIYFQPLIKALRPNGPLLLNGLKRDEIVSIVRSYMTEVRVNARKQ
jgi:hypothetical protein